MAENGKTGKMVYYKDVTKEYFEEATPGKGNIDKEEGFKDKGNENEIRIANVIHMELGGDILLYNDDLTEDGKNTPDYKWNDQLWDLKSPESIKSLNKRIQKGIHQIESAPGGIIIDLPKDITFAEMADAIRERWIATGVKTAVSLDVIVIRKDRIIKIIRFKS